METLYKNVIVTSDEEHPNSLDFKIGIKEIGKTFCLRKCQAYTDFEINPMCPQTYNGRYEIWENGISYEKRGTLHIYHDHADILLEE